MLRLIALALLMLTLAACATRPVSTPPAPTPVVRLSPASLGAPMARQQQLEFRFGRQRQVVDALLEVDASEVRLALLAMGQSALRLRWDGAELHETRAVWLPAALQSERVLSDLQLVYWPVADIQRALPDGWMMRESTGSRQLLQGDEVVVDILFPSSNRIELTQRRDGYQLIIASAATGDPAP